MKTIIDEILEAYSRFGFVKPTAVAVGCSSHRVKKILSSNGIIINDTHYLILKYAGEGKSAEEIAKLLKLSKRTVETYLPTVRPYYLVNPSQNAKRVKSCKERKKKGVPNPKNKSGVPGVCRAGDKWIAYINYQKKHYHLGSYSKREEAAAVRKNAEKAVESDFEKWYESNFLLVNKRRIKKTLDN